MANISDILRAFLNEIGKHNPHRDLRILKNKIDF